MAARLQYARFTPITPITLAAGYHKQQNRSQREAGNGVILHAGLVSRVDASPVIRPESVSLLAQESRDVVGLHAILFQRPDGFRG